MLITTVWNKKPSSDNFFNLNFLTSEKKGRTNCTINLYKIAKLKSKDQTKTPKQRKSNCGIFFLLFFESLKAFNSYITFNFIIWN